jgi:hypothetical protein
VWVHEAIMADVSSWCVSSWGNHDGAWVHGACEFMGREFISSWGVSSWGNHGRREFMVRGFMRQSWWCVSSWCVSSWGNHGRREFMVREFMRQSWWCVGSRNCSPISEHCSCVSAGKCSWSCDEDFCVETTEIVHEAIMAGVVSGSGSWFWGCDQDLCIKVKLKEWRGFLYHYQIEGVTRIFVSKSNWRCDEDLCIKIKIVEIVHEAIMAVHGFREEQLVWQLQVQIFPLWKYFRYASMMVHISMRAAVLLHIPFFVIRVTSTERNKPAFHCHSGGEHKKHKAPTLWQFLVYRVGQNCVYNFTVYLMIFLPKRPLVHRICIYGSGQPYSCVRIQMPLFLISYERRPRCYL